MNAKWRSLVALLLLAVVNWSIANASVVADGAKVEKLAGGFKFTEGPAADAQGNVFFTDIPNNRIHKWSLDGKLSTFREKSGGANGLYFDEEGHLLTCEGGGRRLVSIDMKGNVTVLADEYQGKKFNSLNDLCHLVWNVISFRACSRVHNMVQTKAMCCTSMTRSNSASCLSQLSC